jgi:hypothetical protein
MLSGDRHMQSPETLAIVVPVVASAEARGAAGGDDAIEPPAA